jgi:catechol 2,3-dioxygenase-like lactoylglutathione lyase family enzyme
MCCFSVLTFGCGENQEDAQVNPLRDFGITANNVFFYYDSLERATTFYTQTLGLSIAADYGFAKILHVAPTSYITLVDATRGMHTTAEPKTVAIALLTDQLDEWYEYLGGEDVEIKYQYEPVEGRPHHGFVALDPEGYYLEFERFNEHPENEHFIPLLEQTETIFPDPALSTTVPQGLGFKATILWLYYRDLEGIQHFYEEHLGLNMIVDQGWAKIYQTSPSGYIGPVDATIDGWFDYVKGHDAFELRLGEISEDDERFRAFVGYDPEGYYLEFDKFLIHDDNARLLQALRR